MQHRTNTGRRALCALVALATAATVAACSGRDRDAGSSGDREDNSTFSTPPAASGPVDSVTWATRTEPSSLDSAVAFGGDVLAVLANTCEGLLQQQVDGSTTPMLASAVDRPDDKTYVFTLRDNVRFFDGEPMTAEDVVFSLKRTLDPETGSFFGSYGKHVTSVKATGDGQVTVKLSQPDPVFYQMLATPLGHVVEKAYVEQAAAAYGTAEAPPMCTGPYEVAEWQKGRSITLEANEDWWKDDEQLTRSAKFLFVADDSTLTAGLTAGDIDGTFVASSSSLPALQAASDVNVYSGPSATFHSLIVAHTGGILADTNMREAVRKIIDYEGTVQTLLGGLAEPMRAIAPPGSWGDQEDIYQEAYDALPPAEQDLTGAQELIEQSGNANAALTLGVPGFLPDFRAFAESFQSSAEQAGLKVKLDLLPKAEFFALFSDPEARAKVDLFYSDYVAFIPDPTELYSAIALPDGAANFGGYSNAEVVDLMTEVSTTVEATDRAELVTQAQELIMADLPWIPFAYQYQTLPLNKRLAGTMVASPTWLYTAWLPKTGAAS